MKEETLAKKIEKQAARYKLRALEGHGDDKRHDQVQADERKWMVKAHDELGWSAAKIGDVFDRDARTVGRKIKRRKRKEEARVEQRPDEKISVKEIEKAQVEIWILALLQKAPLERIAAQFSMDREAPKEHSWAAIAKMIKEFALLSPAQVQQLPEPLQAHWRELQPEEVARPPEVSRPENWRRRARPSKPQGSYETVLQKLITDCWKEVRRYYPTDLLWNWIGHSDELLSTGTYHGDVVALVRSQIEGRRAGRSLLAPYLQAERHPKFRLLIGTQKTPDLSEALDAWRRRITTYIQAFHRMLEKTEPLSAHVFDALAAEASGQGFEGAPWLDSTRPDGVVIRAVLERLVIAFVNCELLTTSVAELPAHPNWTQLTNRLEVLRLRINLQLVELIGFVPSGGWQRRITDSQVLLQDGPLGVTGEFLDELRSLRPTQGRILKLLGELGGEEAYGWSDIDDTYNKAVHG